MGKVYKAYRADDPQGLLAVKLMRPEIAGEPDLVSRFLQEARLLRSIDHENVVRILDLVAEGDDLAIVMEYVPDGDLRQAVTLPAPAGFATDIVGQVAEGLAAIHAVGITHRDLKPENILIEWDPEGALRPRVTDFGMSRHVDTVPSGRTGIVGTTAYLSPEVAAGEPAGNSADVYALGVIYLELCTGRRHPSWTGRESGRGETAVPGAESLPEDLRALLSDMVSKYPEDRPTAEEVADRCWMLPFSPEDLVPLPIISSPGRQDTLSPENSPPTRHALGDLNSDPVTEEDVDEPGRSDPGEVQETLLRVPREDESIGNMDTLTSIPAGPAEEAGIDADPAEAGLDSVDEDGDTEVVLDDPVEPVRALPRTGGQQLPLAGQPHTEQLGVEHIQAEHIQAEQPRTRSAARALASTSLTTAGNGSGKGRRRRFRRMSALWRPALILAFILGIVVPTTLAMRSEVPEETGVAPSVTAVPGTDSLDGTATPTPTATQAPPVPSLAVYEPTSNPVVDFNRRAPLRISGVDAGSGQVASITVLYSGASKQVTPKESVSTYTTTVAELTNGKTYSFTVRVCNTDDMCSTSTEVTHTPYTTPTLQAPVLVARDNDHMSLSWQALSLHGHPGTWTCRISTDSTFPDINAPQNREVDVTGGSLMWDPRTGGEYTVTETCTHESMTVRASSERVRVM
jgi:serine/threonine protein kinase